jgi:hypothetical protein
LARSFFISKPIIEQVNKGFLTWSQKASGNPESIIVSFDNNSILLLDSKTGEIKSTIYPPPTPTLIDTILFQMSLSRLILLLQNGALCFYKVYGRETATLELMQHAVMLKDAEGKYLASTSITTIMLTSIVPPHFDCELFSDGTVKPVKRNAKKEQNRNLDRSPSPQSEDLDFDAETDADDNFLAIGLTKGHIIFVRLDMSSYIYARFAIHRQSVIHLEQIRSQKVFLSMCSELLLHLWGFENNNVVKYRSYEMIRPLSHVKVIK